MASYTGYIPALDASDYDTKISAFITDVETDMDAVQTIQALHNTKILAIIAALDGTQDYDLNDGVSIVFGDDSDTTIKHINGTGTEIRHNGTDGSLFLYSGSTSIEMDSSKITTNANIYISGSSNPTMYLDPTSSGGYMAYTLLDTSGYWRAQFSYADSTGDVSIVRKDSLNVQETKVVLNDNKTVSVYGTTGSDPGADPVNASDLCNKSYTDGKTGGAVVTSAGVLTNGSSTITVSKVTTGEYKVTHNLGHIDYAATASITNVSIGTVQMIRILSILNNSYNVYITDAVGALIDAGFQTNFVTW